MAQNTKNETELNAQEMCEALGISMPTLRRRVKAGALHPIEKPKGLLRHHRLRFERAEIERYIKANS